MAAASLVASVMTSDDGDELNIYKTDRQTDGRTDGRTGAENERACFTAASMTFISPTLPILLLPLSSSVTRDSADAQLMRTIHITSPTTYAFRRIVSVLCPRNQH